MIDKCDICKVRPVSMIKDGCRLVSGDYAEYLKWARKYEPMLFCSECVPHKGQNQRYVMHIHHLLHEIWKEAKLNDTGITYNPPVRAGSSTD